MAIKVGSRNASITIAGADQKIILDFIGEMSAQMVRDVEEEVEKVYVSARDAWPGNPKDPDISLYDSSRATDSRRQRMARGGYRGPRWAPIKNAENDAPTRDPRGSWANLQRETRIDIERSVIVGRVWNDVSYGKFIKAVRLGGKSVFVELIRKPMNKMKTRLTKTLLKTMADGFDNG